MRRFLPLFGCLAVGGALFALFGSDGPSGATRTLRDTGMETSRPTSAPPDLADFITGAEAYLRGHPADARIWADLGGAHVEQARRTGDPAHYARARSAFERSLRLSPEVDAMIGMGALANARHEFGAARSWGLRARRAAPYRWSLYAVLTDAYTELGRYGKAERALQRMLDGRPDVASLSRAAHLLRLRGQTERARAVLQRTRSMASAPADLALCDFQLGELEWGEGRPREALRAYGQALTADPGHAPSFAGRARAEAALGWTGAAIRDYGAAVARDPGFAAELGELYEYLGQPARAAQQYAVFAAEHRLMRAKGVADDLEAGRFAADHGDPGSAVRRLSAEWRRRGSVEVADALGWALHRAGRDAEAAGYAARAERLGDRDALFAYHRGEIERALGHTTSARAHLTRALRINPYFSLQDAPRARQALIELREAPSPPPPPSPRPPPPSPRPTETARDGTSGDSPAERTPRVQEGLTAGEHHRA
ncbi:tetratricopeptide repeat protein [Streptosporangium sp. NPDC051023]|uniref:tetratricopeptide repeat protein n=1 Tax=Streptosporangium sp. NPDC051023 TaxID=3155410 RepID=UPI00344D30E1